MKTIVDNLAVEYSDQGEGPTIVVLHGWADNLHTFDKLVAELSGFRIVRLDLPGFGGSERPRETWDVGAYVDFVSHFLEKNNIVRYDLIGHSFGGRVAIKGTATKILQPDKLILIASAGVLKRNTLRNRILRLVGKIGKTITRVPPFSFWRQSIRKKLYQKIGSDYFAAGPMRDIFLKSISEDLLPYARSIAIPTLLIWGSDDTSTILADAELIHQNIVGSQLKVIDGATHFVHQEHSREVADLIREFV